MTRDKPTLAAAPDRLRIDKWLWAARFFKTRDLAQQAVEGGLVRLAGERIKSSREVRAGDRLAIRVGDSEWVVTVLRISRLRGPAPVARLLYQEDETSRLARQNQMEAKKFASDPSRDLHGRPTKRDRRLIHRFQQGE